DDVEDPGGAAAGVIFCTGVGDDLHALDRIGGDLVEGEGSRSSVDEDGGGAVAEGYVAVDVHLYGGHVLHYIDACAALCGDVFFYVVYFTIDPHLDKGFGSCHS